MEKIDIESEQEGESKYKEATSDLKIQLNSSVGDSSDSSPKVEISLVPVEDIVSGLLILIDSQPECPDEKSFNL
jgi:hypothetical protein